MYLLHIASVAAKFVLMFASVSRHARAKTCDVIGAGRLTLFSVARALGPSGNACVCAQQTSFIESSASVAESPFIIVFPSLHSHLIHLAPRPQQRSCNNHEEAPMWRYSLATVSCLITTVSAGTLPLKPTLITLSYALRYLWEYKPYTSVCAMQYYLEKSKFFVLKMC